MAFDQLKIEIMMLFTEMENQPEDKWELHEAIREKLSELKSFGMPLSQDLVDLERKLNQELAKKSKIVPRRRIYKIRAVATEGNQCLRGLLTPVCWETSEIGTSMIAACAL